MKIALDQLGTFFLAALIFSCMSFSAPAVSEAEIYKYVDKDGVLHFTNVPTQPDYRRLPSLPSYTYAPNRGRANYVRLPQSRSLIPPGDKSDHKAYDQHIKLACRRHGLDQNLVKAVIRAESAFDSQAVSPKGAMGLMQLMPDTSKDMGVADPFDPYQNIEGGTRYLKYLLNRFNNDVTLALAAYNAGPENVQKHGGIPPYDETQTYVQKVLDYYSRYTR